MSNHTPSPWYVYKKDGYNHEVRHKNGKFIYGVEMSDSVCEVYSHRDGKVEHQHKEAQANAQLIAAAPELLGALKGLLLSYKTVFEGEAPNGVIFEDEPGVFEALQAIAKAEGRA